LRHGVDRSRPTPRYVTTSVYEPFTEYEYATGPTVGVKR